MWQEMGEPVTVFDAEGSLENIKEKTVDGFIIAGTTARGGVRARGTAAIAGAIVGSIDGITDVRQYMRRLRPKVTIYGP
jgi:cytoskeletal protein CcmA (bactofilin family)